MTNQQIVDKVENALPAKLDQRIKGKILDAVWHTLNKECGIDLEDCRTSSKRLAMKRTHRGGPWGYMK